MISSMDSNVVSPCVACMVMIDELDATQVFWESGTAEGATAALGCTANEQSVP